MSGTSLRPARHTQEAMVRKPNSWLPDYSPKPFMDGDLQLWTDSGSQVWGMCDGPKRLTRFRELPAKSSHTARRFSGGLAAIGSSPPTCLAASVRGIIASRQRSCDRRPSSPPSACTSRSEGDASVFSAACRAVKRRENRTTHPARQFLLPLSARQIGIPPATAKEEGRPRAGPPRSWQWQSQSHIVVHKLEGRRRSSGI